MIIGGIKICDTCRKAMKVIGADLHDVGEQSLAMQDLERFYKMFGSSLVNRRASTWRCLDEAERKEHHMMLLLCDPTLMKRPVIAKEGGLL